MGEQADEIRTDETLVVMPGGPDEPVLALGRTTGYEHLGEPLEPVAPQLLGRFLDAAGLAGAGVASSELLEGRWVRLSDKTARLLAQDGHDLMESGGMRIGVVRGDRGRIADVVEFSEVAVNQAAAGILLAGMATQRKLAAIERAIEDLTERVDVLVEGSRIAVEARLAAALDTIRRVERRVADRGRVDDRDWASLAEAEPTVKELYHQTVRWLDPLRTALTDGKLGVADQVRLLKANLGIRDVAFWLRMYAFSELALKRWEQLYLLHVADSAPERLADEARFLLDGARARHRELLTLYELLTGYLDHEKELGLLERTRIISRVRLARLRFELDQIVNAYSSALGHAAREVPTFVPDDPAAAAGPIVDLEALRGEVADVAGDAVAATAEIARWAGSTTSRGVRKAGSWLGGRVKRPSGSDDDG